MKVDAGQLHIVRRIRERSDFIDCYKYLRYECSVEEHLETLTPTRKDSFQTNQPKNVTSSEPVTLRLFSLLFVLSGFSALVYQILWQRILTLFSGGDVFAATIMVAVFMAGLGFGSIIGGHLADRFNRHTLILLFAFCEIGIAIFAVGSVWLYHNVLLEHLGELARSRSTLALLLFAGFLCPTVLMGMSLPFLSKTLTHSIDVAPKVIAKLYAFNTLGAALGAFITTWFLTRKFGIERTIQIGAVLNLFCGLGAIAFAYLHKVKGRIKTGEIVEEIAARTTTPAVTPVFLCFLIYSMSGFFALSLEILWFRLLGVVLKASTFTFGHLLSIYLLGLGAGSLVGIRWSINLKSAWQMFLVLQSAIWAYSIFTIIILASAADISVSPFFWKYLVAYDPLNLEEVINFTFSKDFLLLYCLIPFLFIFPATFTMGLSYPILQKVLQTDLNHVGRRVGWLQTSNYMGSVAGTFLTGLVFLTAFGTVQTFKLLLAAACIFLITLFVTSPANLRWKLVAVVGLFVFGFLFWKTPSANHLWSKLHGVDEKSIIAAEDGSGLTVLRASIPDFTQAILFNGGIGIGEIPYFDFHIKLGMIPVMLHPDPKEIAIVGLGSGATLFAASGRAETQQLKCFEIIASQKQVLEKYGALHTPTRTLLEDPRIQYEFGDARLLLRLGNKKYDIIETDPIRPDGKHSGNVYSEEYFSLLKEKLKPRGFAVSWAPTPRTVDTFYKVFPYCLYLWMPGALLIGSNEPIEWDRELIRSNMMSEFSIRHYRIGDINVEAFLQEILIEPRTITPSYDRSRIGDFNTDLFPKDEYLVPQTEEFP